MTDTQSLPVGRGAPTPTDGPPALVGVGTRLGRYEILAPLARGGMAEVWVARQSGELGFEREVALKTIRPEHAKDVAFRRSFLEEARVASRLRHAHVVEVLDLGEEADVVYLAMPLVDGPSLRQLEDQEGRLPLQLALRIMLDVLAGLHAAHELADAKGTPMQLVHRDVSPHNVLIGRDGIAKLADFGVAKALGRLVEETDQGQLRGKIGYFSPEQVQRQPIDRRSDLFSVGVILWELATHRRLFLGGDLIEALVRVAKADAPNPRRFAPDVPEPVAAVIGRALCRDPAGRPGTAAELASALEAAAQTAGVAIATHRELAARVAQVSPPRTFPKRAPLPLTPLPVEAQSEGLQVVATGVSEALPRRPWVPLGLVAGAIVLIGAILGFVGSRRTPEVQALPTPPPVAEIAPAAPPPSTIEPPPVEAPPPDPTNRAVDPSPSEGPSRSSNKRSTPRTQPPSKPKFANPYGP
ncbi:MAG: serine/threonine protein kinase [Deltaproteobacteria bacterium]|nr:serine/threonine protein kinase [Deltaproteobacteria bacterium]